MGVPSSSRTETSPRSSPVRGLQNPRCRNSPRAQEHPLHDDSGNSYGTAHPLFGMCWADAEGVWKVALLNGGMRTISWRIDRRNLGHRARRRSDHDDPRLLGGRRRSTHPRILTNDPRTLDKAVTFDLPTERSRVIIFPN